MAKEDLEDNVKDLISVIMSTYYEPLTWIEQAVDSILNQTYRDIEFIIVIDAPDNMELVRYAMKKKEQDNRIIVHINEKNMGLTASLNTAIKLANGEYIARMDADDTAEFDRLSCQMEYLISHNLDLIGCNVKDIDENGKILNPIGTHYPTSDKVIKKFLKTNSAIIHPTWLTRKSVYIEMGMYHDFPACEDYEFLTRIALAGYRLGNLKEAKQMYRINTKGISNTKKIMQKSSHYFVKHNYNAKRQSNLDEFYQCIESDAGKKKQKSLRNYYEDSAKLKEYYRARKWGMFLTAGIKTFIKSAEGRTVVISIFREKLLQLRYGKCY